MIAFCTENQSDDLRKKSPFFNVVVKFHKNVDVENGQYIFW